MIKNRLAVHDELFAAIQLASLTADGYVQYFPSHSYAASVGEEGRWREVGSPLEVFFPSKLTWYFCVKRI